MYRVTFYVTLPGRDELESPRLEEQVEGTLKLRSHRQTLFGLLDVEHDVGGPIIDNDLLLTGTTQHADSSMNYTIQPASIGRNTAITDAEMVVVHSAGGLRLCTVSRLLCK